MAIAYPLFFDLVVLDAAGKPAAGGTFNAYFSGTSVPASIYNSSGVEILQPVILGSDGRVDFRISDTHAYRLVAKTAGGVTCFQKDNVTTGGSGSVPVDTYVPYTGASSDVVLGSFRLTARTLTADDGAGNLGGLSGSSVSLIGPHGSTTIDNAGSEGNTLMLASGDMILQGNGIILGDLGGGVKVPSLASSPLLAADATGKLVEASGYLVPAGGTAHQLLEKQSATDGDTAWVDAPESETLTKISAADTTPGYLSGKLAAGTNVTLTVLNPGGDEQLQIDFSDPDPTNYVPYTGADQTVDLGDEEIKAARLWRTAGSTLKVEVPSSGTSPACTMNLDPTMGQVILENANGTSTARLQLNGTGPSSARSIRLAVDYGSTLGAELRMTPGTRIDLEAYGNDPMVFSTNNSANSFGLVSDKFFIAPANLNNAGSLPADKMITGNPAGELFWQAIPAAGSIDLTPIDYSLAGVVGSVQTAKFNPAFSTVNGWYLPTGRTATLKSIGFKSRSLNSGVIGQTLKVMLKSYSPNNATQRGYGDGTLIGAERTLYTSTLATTLWDACGQVTGLSDSLPAGLVYYLDISQINISSIDDLVFTLWVEIT